MAKTDPEAPTPHKATVQVASGRGVAQRWHRQYCHDGRWRILPAGGINPEAIYDKLCALGENPDPDAVADIIGNRSWSFVRCCACGEHVDRAVRLGDGFSDSDPVLCRACCFEGVLALMSQRTDKTSALDESMPGWRHAVHANGAPKFARDGTMLDDRGNRSIFDDVDE